MDFRAALHYLHVSSCWYLRPRTPAKDQGLLREARAGLQGAVTRSRELRDKALKGGTRYLPKLREQNKLTARERLDLLLDADSFVEDGLFANVNADELPADGVVTGLGTIEGRQVAVMANDPTVKAGSWGAGPSRRSCASRRPRPGSACRSSTSSTPPAPESPTRSTCSRPAPRGRIFFNEVQLSGQVPQICMLFGPSAAGGAYIPAFCDVVIMVEGNASMYLGSPRMVEVVVGEKVTLEELGGARMHATESGLGDALVADDQEAIEFAKAYFRYMPQRSGEKPAVCSPAAPRAVESRSARSSLKSRTAAMTCAR
jgi:acetyl-CoA carboxylase carboxyltransferase component